MSRASASGDADELVSLQTKTPFGVFSAVVQTAFGVLFLIGTVQRLQEEVLEVEPFDILREDLLGIHQL